MLGWRWRGFCNTYSMTMLHFVPFTSIDRSSSSVGATSISFDSSSASKTSPLTVLTNSSDSTGSGHIFRMIGRSNLSSRFALMRLKEEIQGNVRRQLEIVKPDVTDEEIDTVLRADGSSNRVMRSAILRNSADPIKDAYAHAADRYQDVLKLEQSVAELHQLFLDFALLTEQQGEALDQIEYQVRAAGEYVESGNADIRYAIKYQTELRRRYCCCCVIVVVVLGVVLIYLAVTNPRLFKKIK